MKKKLKLLQSDFLKQLDVAIGNLDEAAAQGLALAILREGIEDILGRRVVEHRSHVSVEVEGWWDRYRVTLLSIERERNVTAAKLQGFLERLGYGQ